MALTIAVGACAGAGDEGGSACPPSPFRSSPPKVIAHAGGEGLGPANTLYTMRRSVAAGADLLDVDLWMTSDGVVVAHHDRSLMATAGVDRNVDEISWAELQAFDARAGWNGEPIGEPVRFASLEQILTSFPDFVVSLEIKQHDPPISTALCEVLRRTASIERVYLSSNEDESVYAARRACPGVEITTTYADVAVMRDVRDRGEAWCAPAAIGQPPYRADRFDPANVSWSHEHGLAVFTWTVDDPATLAMLAEAGVDGVYTRRPDVARRVFDEFAAARE